MSEINERENELTEYLKNDVEEGETGSVDNLDGLRKLQRLLKKKKNGLIARIRKSYDEDEKNRLGEKWYMVVRGLNDVSRKLEKFEEKRREKLRESE